ncbi:MAG TPA: hypothetical protein DHN33_09425 [Eubacteriaceae bacterium]|nr:hypothetical protein [Eubacteriaceae bacterium]
MQSMYSEKETLIFEGVIHLLERGISPYTMKVSDIAQNASIGKGTIYEYFESKEEVIAKGLEYYAARMITDVRKDLARMDSFEEQFNRLLDLIEQHFAKHQNSTDLFDILGKLALYYKEKLPDRKLEQQFFQAFDRIVDPLIDTACKERWLPEDNTPYYNRTVIKGALSGFKEYILFYENHENVTIEEARKTAYQMVRKALK